MRRAGRATPQGCAKTFPIGSVLLESFQAVQELHRGERHPDEGAVARTWCRNATACRRGETRRFLQALRRNIEGTASRSRLKIVHGLALRSEAPHRAAMEEYAVSR